MLLTLVAGLQIESVQPYHVRYRLHSGTVGGFFLISENVFVCTAGHCATVNEDSLSTINDGCHEENMKKYDPEQSEIDIKSFVKQDNEFDIAVLPLFRIKKGFSFLNRFTSLFLTQRHYNLVQSLESSEARQELRLDCLWE